MYNKEGKINLETTAHIQSKLKTNIQFYNTDVGTANLVFNVTRNGSPLLVSSENADVFLILKNDTSYIVDTVTPTDPLNGRMKYTIPNEFLSLTGKVDGQLYIAVHGKEDIVTEIEFSFNIANSLINTIPAVDKLNEIKTFQQFREDIMESIRIINEGLENGFDYVSQLDAAKASGLKAINDRTTQVISDIETLVNTSKQSLTDIKNSSITELENKATQIKEDVEALNNYDTTNWQKHKITQDDGMVKLISSPDLSNIDTLFTKTEMYYVTNSVGGPVGENGNAYIDVKFRTNNLGIITYQAYNSSKKFIKRKESGVWTDWILLNPEVNKRKTLGTIGVENSEYNDLLTLKPGFYECVIPSDAFRVNAPQEPNGKSYYAEIDVYEGNSGRKQFRLIMSHLNTEYHATVHTDGVETNAFKGWKRVQDIEEFSALNSDTGWIDWDTMNGATKRDTDIPTAIKCQRRVRMVNGVKIGHLRVNVNNVVTQTAFGSIPADMVPKTEHFYARTPVTLNPAVVLLDVNGNLMFYVNTNDATKWLPGHYIIGEFSWIIDDVGGGE
ncbi:BppU family phage baseplate upper protein [Mammaliicoccus sciuri]|uniref:BppU family phage baseplate upper protein n=1 Tax=Mammaliicoccus sciuri TaxID=1296 RepID=UPI001FB23CAF|nr:BppU family phage baseplate upper protein [Mammaliicoccus sciuri]MCJ0969736.1 BppU family phage baseplate upper protein [Mammaliicoccus sciuri]